MTRDGDTTLSLVMFQFINKLKRNNNMASFLIVVTTSTLFLLIVSCYCLHIVLNREN